MKHKYTNTLRPCPFCGNNTKYVENKHVCEICSGEIYEEECSITKQKYYVSKIKKQTSSNDSEKRRFLHDRFSEAQYHFRNITPISLDGSIVCPKCNQKH